MTARPALGCHGAAGAPIPAQAGVGLRFAHHQRFLTERPSVAWLEAHPENYLGWGAAAETLEALRADYPISFHATGLSLGSACGLDAAHLAAVADLAHRTAPALISDHLSWSAAGGVHAPDLLPLPYTEEALLVVARNVDAAQEGLRRRLLVENPSAYLRFAGCVLSEAEFLGELARRTGCGVLLDVNNIFVSASNLGEDPLRRLRAMLEAVPAAAIGEIHVAGHTTRQLGDGKPLRIDDHGSRVSAAVWAMFAEVVATIGPRPALIEWDTDVPPLETLMDEAAIADALIGLGQMEARRA